MLNIPELVKNLFKQDGVRKNFHVHFPNGETTDLNNENILSESVQFTESLCSQQYFKFGLAEASQIEFTAVGIPNILGVYIECAIEIDCTSLGSTWAEENPVDSTLDFLEPQTCEYDNKIYYRVPYGRFKVDSCPRNHGAMWQRKITAYTDNFSSIKDQVIEGEYPTSKYILNPGEWWKSQQISAESMMSRQLMRFSDAWVPTLYGSSFNDTIAISSGIGCCGVNSSARPGFVYTFEDGSARPLGVYALEVDYKPHEFDDYGRALCDAALASLPNTNYYYGYANTETGTRIKLFNNVNEAIAGKFGCFLPCFYIGVHYQDSDSAPINRFTRFSKPVFIKPKQRHIIDLKDFKNFVFCRDVPKNYYFSGDVDLYVCVPMVWSNSATWRYGTSSTRNISGWEDAAPFNGRETVYRDGEVTVRYMQIENIAIYPQMSIKNTLEYSKGKGLNQYYTYSNAVSALKLIEGMMEILGRFLKANRDGGNGEFNLSDNVTPIAVSSSDWLEFWWDENDVEPIGTVGVKMLSDSEDEDENQSEQLVQYSIGNGESVYLMEDNEVLSNTTATADEIQDVLNEYFAPNASVVNFTPVDLEMRGLPYLEDGDYIQLTAEDGTTVNTYILEQTISGIQHLTVDVTSTNGELLEVIEE